MNSIPVVLRYRDGHTERVSSAQTDIEQQLVRVTRDGEASSEVSFALLKALFFPRLDLEKPLEEAAGSTIAVEFADGEVIRGIAHYNPESTGFTLFPQDRSKNERIFVITSAIVSIEVEKL